MTNYSAKCPHCDHPHHYSEVKFSIANDRGYWEVACEACGKEFVIKVLNPRESGGKIKSQVRQFHEEEFVGDASIVAKEIVKHSIDLNKNQWRFKFDQACVYECEKSGENLELLAKGEFEKHLPEISGAYTDAVNRATKGRGADPEFAVVKVALTCPCGAPHKATFYVPFRVDPFSAPPVADAYLLADVTGSSLDQTLDGLLSKTAAMEILEKLVIRWNLLADQILLASPFVGYQQTGPEKLQQIWSWLLGILDYRKSILLTREGTWKGYDSSMAESGIPTDLLREFGLENVVVSRREKKQDFHAKIYVGMTASTCEVYGGSANIVPGPSIENMTFRSISRSDFDTRYIQPLNLKKGVPAPDTRPVRWVVIEHKKGIWSAFDGTKGTLSSEPAACSLRNP